MSSSEDEKSSGADQPSASEAVTDAPLSLWRRIGQNVFARLLIYYVVSTTAATSLMLSLPGLGDALDRERERHAILAPGANELSSVSMTTSQLLTEWTGPVVLLSLVLAILIALPVAWVYGWTSSKKYYSQTFAQSLVVFPAAIATVVFLVKGSLALAFSLAGIVAAVRFRNQLSETRDAIFLFVAIGIGLAAGVQMLVVAVVASATFNVTILTLSARNFGARPARLEGVTLRKRERKPKKAKDPGETKEQGAR